MKHKVLFILLQTMVLFCGKAMALEITIGNGTYGSSIAPYSNSYRYSTTQSIYTASEIGQSGLIKNIAFDVVTASSYSMSNVTIYMGHKSSTYFGSPVKPCV